MAEPFFALDPDALRCPHQYFARVRDQGPVVWVEDVKAYAITRHRDAVDVLRRTSEFSSTMPGGSASVARFKSLAAQAVQRSEDLALLLGSCSMIADQPVLISADPPLHTRQRSLVNRSFTARRVRTLEPDVHGLANELVDLFVDRGSCEFVSEFAVPLPLRVIMRVFGLPDDDLPQVKQWSDDSILGVGNQGLDEDGVQRMLTSTVQMLQYLLGHVERRRVTPADDFITDLVDAATADGEHYTEPELLGVLTQFLIAGNETTTRLLATGLMTLISDSELRQRLDEDRSLIASFVEEILRLEPPLLAIFRYALRDTVVAGITIPAGSDVFVMYASGNRDPEAFVEPDAVVLDRANAQSHLAFSWGPHFCPGAALSRLEARIAFDTILDRLDELQFGPNTFDQPRSYLLHGVDLLNITFRSTRSLSEGRG